MKPVCKICNNTRPGVCNQTLFGLNVESRDGRTVIHGDLRKKVT